MSEIQFRRPAQKVLADLDRTQELSEMAGKFVSELDEYLSRMSTVPEQTVDPRRTKFGLIVNPNMTKEST
jgi:hypothetical protein